MALPQQVLERLSREPPGTPGWSYGLLFFSGAIFLIALLVYFGLIFGYEPYLTNQMKGISAELQALAATITPQNEAQLSTFYSEVANMQRALSGHVALSPIFTLLERDTEANVYYTNLTITDGVAGNSVDLQGNASTEADVNQQMAIFEADPEIQAVQISSVSLSSQTNEWQFSMMLTMKSFLANQPTQTASSTQ